MLENAEHYLKVKGRPNYATQRNKWTVKAFISTSPSPENKLSFGAVRKYMFQRN